MDRRLRQRHAVPGRRRGTAEPAPGPRRAAVRCCAACERERSAPSSAPIKASVTSRACEASSPRDEEVRATPVDPALEHRRRGFAEFLDGVGDLGGDAGDRAHVREPGAGHVLGGLGENAVDRVAEVGVLVDDRRDEQRVGVAGVDQRLARDLHLAAAEVVVQRADRRAGGRSDVLHADRAVALVPHQLRRGGQNRFPGRPCHFRLPATD